jgi:hypothetical protein
MKNTFLVLIAFSGMLLLISTAADCQPRKIPAELQQQLAGQSNLERIMNIVSDYYKSKPALTLQSSGNPNDEFEKDPMNAWARWALEQSNRLHENGDIANFKVLNYDAYKQQAAKEQKDPSIIENSNTGSWTFLGPSSSSYGSTQQNYLGLGRVDRIAFHPSNTNTIFVGTPSGGLWRTTDNGTSWTMLTKYLPSPGISGIVVSSTNANVIYILTGDGDSDLGNGLVNNMGYVRRSVGVLKSTDGGSTWFETGELPGSNDQTVGYKLVQDPNNSNILIAATSNGLYRTTNGGTSWTQERTGKFWDVAYRPGNSSFVYATGNGSDRFVRSTDGGATWSATITYSPSTPSSTGRGHIAVAPSNGTVVYVLWGPVTGDGSFKGLYKSTDYGVNFTRQTTTPNILGNADDGSDNADQSSYDIAIAVKPTISTTIVTAGTTIWKSTNSGTTMTKSTSYNEGGSFAYIHPDIHDVAYHPTTNVLYAATDGGVYRSNDDGATWTDISAGVETTQFYRGSGFEGDVNLFLGGSQDNGVKYRGSATSNFRHIICCDGFDTRFYPNNSAKGYGSMNQSVFRFNNFNGGASGINPFVNGKWFVNVATHPTNGSVVYLGTDSFYRSDNEGSSWAVNVNVDAAWCISSCPSNTTRVYAAGGSSPWAGTGTIKRSDDQGATWTVITGTGLPASSNKITDIGVRPTSSAFVWVTIGGYSNGNKVFRTSNADAASPTWTNVSGTLPNLPVNSIAIDANNNAYIGTDIGVYFRSASMSDWVPFFNYLPRVPVTDLILNETSGVIKAVTFGFGLWQSPTYSACPANLSVTGSISGYKVFEAGSSLTSTGIVLGGLATEVFYKSAGSVTLSPGFEARDENKVFKAYIGPCGNGIPSADGQSPQTEELITGVFEGNLIPISKTSMVPFGHIYATHSSQQKIDLQVDAPGIYSLTLHDASGNKLADVFTNTNLQAGRSSFTSAYQRLPGNHYYLKLWMDGALVDVKEW